MSACPQQALLVPPKMVSFAHTSFPIAVADVNAHTVRQVIDASLLSVSGGVVQITIQAGTDGGISIDKMYIGHWAGSGNVWDFDGSQVQVFRRGSASMSTGVAGSSLLTDPVEFDLDETRALIISTHYSGTSFIGGATSVSGCTYTLKAAVDEAATTAPSGYTTVASANTLISRIEVLG